MSPRVVVRAREFFTKIVSHDSWRFVSHPQLANPREALRTGNCTGNSDFVVCYVINFCLLDLTSDVGLSGDRVDSLAFSKLLGHARILRETLSCLDHAMSSILVANILKVIS